MTGTEIYNETKLIEDHAVRKILKEGIIFLLIIMGVPAVGWLVSTILR